MERGEIHELMEGCAAGDESAWAELLRRFGARLTGQVRWALSRNGFPAADEAVEEMLQEVYCRMLEQDGRRLRSCRARDDEEAAAYLCRLAGRVVVDQVRHLRAVKRGGDQVAEAPAAAVDLADRSPAPEASPEERLLAAEGLRRLVRRLGSVESGPQGRRNLQILILATLGEWTSREISRTLRGCPGPSGVESLLSRIRRRLRQAFPEAVPG